MKEDLELSGDRYEWLLTAFYITYIVRFSAMLYTAEQLLIVAAFPMDDSLLEGLCRAYLGHLLRSWVSSSLAKAAGSLC
jgi:hypothetical protein